MASGDGAVRFPLSDSSTLVIQMGGITKWFVDGCTDAIVNSANERMLGGGGGDGAIHRAAGPDLLQACYGVPEARPGVRCPTGEARITPGFKLPASHVIHTVGPVYRPGSIYPPANNPEVYLSSAYRNSLSIAKAHNIQYVAFSPISCGSYGYPYDEAAEVSLSTIKDSVNDIKEGCTLFISRKIFTMSGWKRQRNCLKPNMYKGQGTGSLQIYKPFCQFAM